MIRRYIGITMLLLGAASVDSDWIWVPWALIIAGGILALKKKTPSSRQAKEDVQNKIMQPDYSTGRRRISNER